MTDASDPNRIEHLRDQLWSLDFDAGKSIRYHAYRRSFWQSLDHWSKVLSIVTGAAVVVAVFGQNTVWAKILALLVACTSAADVVLGFGDKANLHDGLYRDWCRLQQKIAALEARTPTNVDIAEMKARRLRIEREEPGHLDLLERRCCAEECIARGCDLRGVWQLTKWQVWLSQWAMWPSAPRVPDLPQQVKS